MSKSNIPIYVDVTHTWNTNLQTGMQKVVRQLCGSWRNNSNPIHLVVFQNGKYRILPENSFTDISILEPNETQNQTKLRLFEKLKKLNRLVIPIFGDSLRGRIFSSSTIIRTRNYFRSSSLDIDLPILDPKNCKILILELIFDLYHLDYILDCAETKNTELTFFCYDLIPVNHSEYCPPEFTIMFKRYLEISRFSKKLWSISDSTRKELENYLSNKSLFKQSVFKWLPPSKYSLCPHDFPFELKSKDLGYLLFVGSFEPRKNHIGFLKCLDIISIDASDFPQICFVGGSSWDDGPINKKIEELRAKGFEIIKLVNIDECCVGKLFEEARATLYPSHFEGFGLPVVESLSFGTPVVTTRIGSTEELLTLPGTLGVNPKDEFDLADKLEQLLTNKPFERKLVQEAENNKLNFNSWDQYAEELYNFIAQQEEIEG